MKKKREPQSLELIIEKRISDKFKKIRYSHGEVLALLNKIHPKYEVEMTHYENEMSLSLYDKHESKHKHLETLWMGLEKQISRTEAQHIASIFCVLVVENQSKEIAKRLFN